MRRWLALGVLVLAACQAAPPAVVPPDPAPSVRPHFVSEPRATPTPPPGVPGDWPRVVGRGGSLTLDFEGPGWEDWKDVRQDGQAPGWLIAGSWRLLPAARPAVGTRAGIALEFSDDTPQPALAFRRYAGKAFGTPDGELPVRYMASVRVVPLGAREDFFPPVGDLGVPVYYLDPTHYVEVLIKPAAFEVWECNGGEPTKWRGWRQLYSEAASHSARVAYTLGGRVDGAAGTMQVFKDGRLKREITSPLIQPYTHYFALRAGSNRVQFDDIQLQGL